MHHHGTVALTRLLQGRKCSTAKTSGAMSPVYRDKHGQLPLHLQRPGDDRCFPLDLGSEDSSEEPSGRDIRP